jgi:CNT family concentrative nucleoside transporter
METFHAEMTFAVLILIAWGLSEDRRGVPLRMVATGFLVQLGLAVILIRVPWTGSIFRVIEAAVLTLQDATDTGARFVFGYLAGGPPPFAPSGKGSDVILGFRFLPLVLVISALSSLLFHWGVMQRIVGLFARGLERSMGIGGALGLGAAVHVFVGMVESPLLIRPYLAKMGRGELFALMTCGMAGIAGTVMVIYAGLIGPVVPDAFIHILAAGLISTPAALAIAGIMVPFHPLAGAEARLSLEEDSTSSMDALVKGTFDGIGLVVGIGAMLLVMVALVTLVNLGFAVLPNWAGAPITLQRLFAGGFQPLVWLIGVPWDESGTAASLMGTKTVLNEFAAYIDFAHLPPDALSPRSRIIMTYALCGFANFGSVGIMVGGLGGMVPERREEIAGLALKSLVSGTMATMMTGALAGAIWGGG